MTTSAREDSPARWSRVGDAARPFNIGEAICSGNAAARAI